MPAVYTKKHLLEALRKENLPHSYKSLLKLERTGVIPCSANGIETISGNRQRLYSAEEMSAIVDKVKTHKG